MCRKCEGGLDSFIEIHCLSSPLKNRIGGPPIGRIAMGMIALIIVAVVAACLLMVWSLCRAAALGDEIAENLRKEAGHEG